MKAIPSLARELLALFVEDWALTLELASLLAAIILMDAFSIGSANARAVLLVGVPAGILLTNVAQARKR